MASKKEEKELAARTQRIFGRALDIICEEGGGVWAGPEMYAMATVSKAEPDPSCLLVSEKAGKNKTTKEALAMLIP